MKKHLPKHLEIDISSFPLIVGEWFYNTGKK